ncbi:lactonase family protein [Asticcacaulis biprosthecium]|uniref:lactonase family protein n=1 Tax=Asticcacaulis biprosthecium TaxID=76891 RepID=UPI000301C628|nr:lactonase family protein [Asticcacaulis biprosthecium]
MTTSILNRRTLMVSALAIATAPACAQTKEGAAAAGNLNLFVGTYNGDDAKGVYPLTYSASADSWTVGQPAPQVENVSFGAYSPKFKRHYLLNEKDDGKVGAWTVAEGVWTLTSEQSAEGSSPCYAALSKDESVLAVANYGGGNVVVYPLSDKGELLAPMANRKNAGSGPNKDRQEGPHAHWVQFSPDQKHIYSVDLGTDQVLAYAFDGKTVGEPVVAFQAPPGSGPRHLAFHPNGEVALLVTELNNLLISLKKNSDGSFTQLQQAPLLPADFAGKSQAAHIAVNAAGTRVYASNRGHHSITVFETDGSGALKLLQIAPTLGDWPRFFALYEAQKRVIVAHQRSNDIVVFTLNDDGTLTPKDQKIAVPRPVFIGAA